MVIKRVQGDTYAQTFQLYNEDESLFDLTGCSVLFTVKRNLQDSNASALMSIAGSVTSAVTGVVEFPITTLQADISGDFFYDIKITDSNNIILHTIKDKIIFYSNVTN